MVCEVIKVDCDRRLTEEFDALNSDLLVLGSLLLSWCVCLERLAKLINTALLPRFIDLLYNNLLKRQSCRVILNHFLEL